MKALSIILTSTIPFVAHGDELEIDLSEYGEPIEIPINSQTASKPETELDRKISTLRKKHGAYNAVLINNSKGQALNKNGQISESEALGTVVNPGEVLVIARAMVAEPVVKLYTSIKKLPDCAHTVRILYTESPDRAKSSLLGYTIENPKGIYTKLVEYDGKTPWLEWITKSFKNDDGEQGSAHQSTTAP